MAAFEVLSLTFSIASILVGAATFLLGFYLVERNRGVTGKQLRQFKYMLLSLLIPLFVLIPFSISTIYYDLTSSLLSFVIICSVVFFIPVLAIITILALSWR